MNAQQITNALVQGTFTNDELQSVIEAVKYARAKLGKATKRSLSVGDNVQWVSSRNGLTVKGTVRKIAIKNVQVATAQGIWNVPANMLEVV
jgi:hypothetical protein